MPFHTNGGEVVSEHGYGRVLFSWGIVLTLKYLEKEWLRGEQTELNCPGTCARADIQHSLDVFVKWRQIQFIVKRDETHVVLQVWQGQKSSTKGEIKRTETSSLELVDVVSDQKNGRSRRTSSFGSR